jgi:hypothetical protein
VATSPQLDRRKLLKLSAATGAASGLAWTGAVAEARTGGLLHRGVVYAVVDGEFPSTTWTAERMRADVETIALDLHANSLLIEGDGPERLLATAEHAVDHGLSVWLRPTLGDVPGDQILDHLAEVGRGAEQLRAAGARVFVSVGCEFVLYVPGIVPGADALDRVHNLLTGHFDPVRVQRKLTSFIRRAARVGRSAFGGPLTYSASADDVVDWRQFDIVGIDYYRWFPHRSGYLRDLKRFRRFGKPVAIMEFGSCTYREAPRTGADGMGWDVVDYTVDPPQIKTGLVRSEGTQARYLVSMLDVFDEVGVAAAMVFNYGDAGAPHRRAHRYDLDIASYGLVAPIWDDFDSPGKGWHWQRKRSFDAVARAYATYPPQEPGGS